jgi:16S rRNA (guanine527-N7)-methyltransferase
VYRRFGLGDAARERLDGLLELLAEAPDAPTSVTDPSAAVDVHVADSLAALELPEVRRAEVIADVGSGAGFPGLPLAAALPQVRVILVESIRRKCDYLHRAIDVAGIDNAEVQCLRVEEWTAGREACDVVAVRALAPLAVVAEYAAPLLRAGGTLVAWGGRRDPAAERDARAAASLLGLVPQPALAVSPYPTSAHRHLHRFVKHRPTPEGFPRRVGMARKRPLRATSGNS